jgi:ADP-heptose:LPS heptosyltransferase
MRPVGRLFRRHRPRWLAGELNDFSDTAAIISIANLVISVDTALCHLAEALGRPVWTLLANALDWCWLRDRTDSSLYSSMKLYRQPKPADWAGVIAELSHDVEAQFQRNEIA